MRDIEAELSSAAAPVASGAEPKDFCGLGSGSSSLFEMLQGFVAALDFALIFCSEAWEGHF